MRASTQKSTLPCEQASVVFGGSVETTASMAATGCKRIAWLPSVPNWARVLPPCVGQPVGPAPVELGRRGHSAKLRRMSVGDATAPKSVLRLRPSLSGSIDTLQDPRIGAERPPEFEIEFEMVAEKDDEISLGSARGAGSCCRGHSRGRCINCAFRRLRRAQAEAAQRGGAVDQPSPFSCGGGSQRTSSPSSSNGRRAFAIAVAEMSCGLAADIQAGACDSAAIPCSLRRARRAH